MLAVSKGWRTFALLIFKSSFCGISGSKEGRCWILVFLPLLSLSMTFGKEKCDLWCQERMRDGLDRFGHLVSKRQSKPCGDARNPKVKDATSNLARIFVIFWFFGAMNESSGAPCVYMLLSLPPWTWPWLESGQQLVSSYCTRLFY